MPYRGYIDRVIKLFPETAEIYEIVKAEMSKYPGASHDLSHVERVMANCWKIYTEEKAGDLKTIFLAVLLHDSKRHEEENSGEDHALSGAEFARTLLLNRGFPTEIVETVHDSIICHSYSNHKVPRFIEGKILQDADRLDTIGAIAIARLFNHNNGIKRPLYSPEIKPKKTYDGISLTYLNHIFEKILKITPDSFWTETAQKMARERYQFTLEFTRKFLREWYALD